MNGKRIAFIAIAFIVIACTTAAASEKFSITSSYSAPIGNSSIDPSLSIGIDYRFWGVFQFTLNTYNDIVLGAENILNIKEIRPIGLFSGGLGMKIPLGGFHFLLDWQKFFTGTVSEAGVFPYSDSYAYGVSLDLSDWFGIEVAQRRLYNFSEEAIADPALNVVSANDTVDLITIGVAFHLF